MKKIVYIHGIGNQLPCDILKGQWDAALFGAPQNDTRMAYWVDRSRYPQPLTNTVSGSDTMCNSLIQPAEVRAGDNSMDEARIMTAIDARVAERAKRFSEQPGEELYKVLPLPGFARKPLTRFLTKTFSDDVYGFLFKKDERARMTDALRAQLAGIKDEPVVIIAHSQGTMIAYDVLMQMQTSGLRVELFATLGSPLGIQEVQDVLAGWHGAPLKAPACVKEWFNAADLWDMVAADPTLKDDYKNNGIITDLEERHLNVHASRDPHSATGYLSSKKVRDVILRAV